MSAYLTSPDIPAGTLVVVARGRNGEQIARTCTPCYGPGRWPFVHRWMGAKWTNQPGKARVLRVATAADVTLLAPGVAGPDDQPAFDPLPRGSRSQLKL